MSVSGDMEIDLAEHPRVRQAMTDHMQDLPGVRYRQVREELEYVWDLLESPIEQMALIQLMSVNYGANGRDIWPKASRERGASPHIYAPVQFIPQVQFGPYRVDILADRGAVGLWAIECDGAAFHEDTDRDKRRDEFLEREHGVHVMRLSGSSIWREKSDLKHFIGAIRGGLRSWG